MWRSCQTRMWWSWRKKVSQLEEAFEKASREHQELKAEWADALDRIGRLAGRVAKRSAVDLREATPDTPDRPNGGSPRSGGSWVIHHGRAIRRE